jgi:hypothetical protein
MIRVLVDHDRIGSKIPVGDVGILVGKNAEAKAPEPKSIRAAALQVEDMTRSEATCKVSVLPGMIQMETLIAASGIVTNPFAIGMHVRAIRMRFNITEVALFSSTLLFRRPHLPRPWVFPRRSSLSSK